MIAGCVGDANLGVAPRFVRVDAGRAPVDSGAIVDAAVGSPDAAVDGALTVELDVALSEARCNTCFELTARSDAVRGDYTLAWDDGSTESRRQVCPSAQSTSYTVTMLEVRSGRTASASRSLVARRGTCPDAGVPRPMLCVTNGTFAIDPARPPTPANALPASPWLSCAKALPNQGLPNRPQIVDSSSTIMGAPVLPATHGTTYLGLAEYEQASEPLCESIGAEETRYFTLDVADVSGSAGADVGLPRLEIWGGRASDCSQVEKLWESDTLTSGWTASCVAITPHNLTDSLTLRAASSAVRVFPGRVLVDNIQSVAACP
ncbi:MAG: hypothetical protein RLZZ450_6537 [Pseudomonadota bacterium]